MTSGNPFPWRPPIYSTARIDALVCPLLVPREALRTHLPAHAALTLEPLPDVPEGTHPVIVEVWKVNDGSIEFGGLPFHLWWERFGATAGAWWGGLLATMAPATQGTWPAAAARMAGSLARRGSEANSTLIGSYNEILATVPCTRDSGGSRLELSFVLRACTDSPFSLVGERFFGWGYQKTRAFGRVVERGTLDIDTGDRNGSVRIAVSAAGSTTHVSRVADVFARPLLGVRPPRHLMLSYLDRAFAHPSVRLQPIHARVTRPEALHAALAGAAEQVASSSAANPWGAFLVTGLPSTLTYPRALDLSINGSVSRAVD